MATNSTVGAETRRQRLLETLATDGTIELEPAAAELGVSTMTVRRDLADLEADGLLRRVRGGAVPSPRARSFAERRDTDASAKSVIAEKALDLVPRQGAVAFDASSSSGVLISRIPGVQDLVLATNSAENFAVARRVEGASPVLIGGEPEPRTDSFVGPMAYAAATSLHYARFFSSAAGVDAEFGTSEVAPAESQLKLAFASVSEETVLLIASSKLGQRAVSRAIAWRDVSVIVTELEPTDPLLDPYRDLVEIL